MNFCNLRSIAACSGLWSNCPKGRRKSCVNTEHKLSERFGELRQPLAQMVTEARETLAEVKSSLDQELGRAKSSLAEIELSASRMNEFSAQLEAATQDSLNDLRRRLEGILDAQTDEMNRRVEAIANGAAQKVAPAIDALGQKLVERTLAEVEAKLAPHLERVPQLLHELSTREMQMEEAMRLHRERLRQVSENSQRELSSHLVSTVAEVRNDFEEARKEAIAKWNEELDASGVRASHAAAESIEHSSQWLQQEAQARLQVLVEQSLATAGAGLEEKVSRSEAKICERPRRGDGAARSADSESGSTVLRESLLGGARTQIEQAAEVTAAAFGQVLRGMSDQEVEHFCERKPNGGARNAISELEVSANRFLRHFEADAEVVAWTFPGPNGIARWNRASLRAARRLPPSSSATLGGYRAERDAHQKEWIEES